MVYETKDDIEAFLDELKKERIKYSNVVAEETVKLLEKIISNSEWNTARELLDIIRTNGCYLMSRQPGQTTIGNMVKRILKIIRDEYLSLVGKHEVSDTQDSLQKMLVSVGQTDYGTHIPALKEAITDSIRELLSELETSPNNIASQSLEHIHSDEVIMTAGRSRTVENFLKKASGKRKFQVIVAEGAPSYDGQELAKNLAQYNVQTTLIPDAAVFAIMSRVNKVIIGTHSVLADGGLKAACGVHAIALAAKHQSVPLIVCAPMFKLTPEFLRCVDQDGFNHMQSPQDVMPFSGGEILSDVEVVNPAFDYVPPDLVTLFVSNIGGNSPSYVYRLLSELYHPEDYDI